MHFLKTSKLVNFCIAILILKMEEIHIFGILCFIISRKVKTQLKCKNIKRSVQCLEKVLGLIEHVKSGLRTSVLEISGWMMLRGSGRPVEVDSNQIETLTESNQCYTTWAIYSQYPNQ